MGDTTAAALSSAAGALASHASKTPGALSISGAGAAKGAPSLATPPSSRLELDVPVELQGINLEEDLAVPLPTIGLKGVFATRDDGATGFVLPAEIVRRGMFKLGKSPRLDREKVAALIAARAGVGVDEAARMRAYLFRSDCHVEAATVGASPLPVLRGMATRAAPVTPERLLAAMRRGADYLVRIMNQEGRYVYLYHPVDDRDDRSYGWLRHAGTTYALLESYEETGDRLYLEKAERALAYLDAHLRRDAQNEAYALDTNDEEQQKVGGAGLALLAYAKHAAVTGGREHLETMRALARFIMKQQYGDGHFRANADVEREQTDRTTKLKREPVYYPGEAILGLMRLYALDAQESYLDAARRGADYVVRVRDAKVSEDNQEHDHWMAYALNELYRVTRDEAYIMHANKIARAIEMKQHREPPPDVGPVPDWIGTFYEGQTTPGATRVEAYDADIALARFAGQPDGWLIDPAQEVARSMLGQQFEDDDDYWLKNPGKADGGVRESLLVQDVRIDYVQHAMSAWLHLARILRDPSYGKAGVPSQDPVR
jgi:hypothetical protein